LLWVTHTLTQSISQSLSHSHIQSLGMGNSLATPITRYTMIRSEVKVEAAQSHF